MTWFFLLGTILTLYDGFVFVLLLVWIRREQKGQHLTKERFRLLVILVISCIVFFLTRNSETGFLATFWETLTTVINAWMPGFEDGDGHSWGIDVEVVGMKGQLLFVIDNGYPPLGHECERVGGHEAVRLVCAKGHATVRLRTEEFTVPLGHRFLTHHPFPSFL